jgi:hypothetical protein
LQRLWAGETLDGVADDRDAVHFVMLPVENSEPASDLALTENDRPAPPRQLPMRRRQRFVTAIAAVCALVALGVVNHHRVRQRSAVQRAGGVSQSAPSSAPAAPAFPPSTGRPWPTEPSACGGVAYLPIVSAGRLAERTDIHVRTGGKLLRMVDVDTGRSSTGVLNLTLAPDEFVTQLMPAGSATYALIVHCDYARGSRVLRIGSTGHASTAVANAEIDRLIPGGDGGWGVDNHGTAPDSAVTLIALDGKRSIHLPLGVEPLAVHGNLIVGLQGRPDGAPSNLADQIVLLDRATGAPRSILGSSYSSTISAGLVLWTERACVADHGCVVHSYDLATGRTVTRSYKLPANATLWGGVISDDRRAVAFQLQRDQPDPRYDSGHPAPPSDVATLDLDTGALTVVPGVELAPKTQSGLVFSADSRWLIIALDAGNRTRLLVWRPGLRHPMESPAQLAGQVLAIPAVLNDAS